MIRDMIYHNTDCTAEKIYYDLVLVLVSIYSIGISMSKQFEIGISKNIHEILPIQLDRCSAQQKFQELPFSFQKHKTIYKLSLKSKDKSPKALKRIKPAQL